MKRSLFLTGLVCVLFLITSCTKDRIDPSGNVTTETFSETGYDKLDVSHAFDVFVTFSDTEESIEVEADDNLQSFVSVEKNNNTLRIKMDKNLSIQGDATLNVFIKTANLEGIDLSGASTIFLENTLTNSKLDVNLSGASEFDGEVDVNDLVVDLSGASDMKILGSCGTFTLDASGASTFKDYSFVADELVADLSGASDAKITVNNSIRVDASGASTLRYKGDPDVEKELSGASSVLKMD